MWPKPSEANESMLLICCNSSHWFSKWLVGRGMSISDSMSSTTWALGRGRYSGMLIFGKAHGAYTVVGVRYHPQQKQSVYGMFFFSKLEMVKSTMNFTHFKCEYADAEISKILCKCCRSLLFMHIWSVSIFGFQQSASYNVFPCEYIYTDTWYDVIWLRLNKDNLSYDNLLWYNMKQQIIETMVFDVFYIFAIVMFQQYNFFQCSIVYNLRQYFVWLLTCLIRFNFIWHDWSHIHWK